MVDLSAPPRIFQGQGHGQKASVSSLSSLLHVGSEFDQFRRAWEDGSIPSSSGPAEDVEPPRPVESPRRPESPWRNRPESPFRTRPESPYRTRSESPFRTQPESPFRGEAPRRAEGLGRAESPSRLPSDSAKSPKKHWGDPLDPDAKSPLSNLEFVPVSPMTASNEPSPVPGNEQTEYFAKGYPSPPPSLRSVNGDTLAPKGRNNNPSALRQVSNAAPQLGPSSLPSPANSTERSSEEDRQAPLWNGPVIQDVAAKRDTISSYYGLSSPRHSLSMDIDQTEKSILAEFNFNDEIKAGKTSPTRSYEAKPSDPSEFAAFNFNDDRPTTSHGPSTRRHMPETPDFSGFNFTEERPKTSAGPRPRGDLPAPLKIQKEPRVPKPQHQPPNSPFMQNPMRAPELDHPSGVWAMDGPRPDNRPRGDRILPPTGPGATRQPPPRLRQQEDELDLEPLEPPVGYFGSTGPRSSRAESFFEPPDSPFARRCPSRDSMRAPCDLERSFDPRLRRAEKPKPRSPSPSSVYDSQPNSPKPPSPPIVRTRPVDITETRSPLEDLFKDSKGDLDLSFSFPSQTRSPNVSTSNFPSPLAKNQSGRDANWPLVSPTSTTAPEPPRPGFKAESRPYTPPLSRNHMPRTDPPLGPPPMPPQKARDARVAPLLRTPTGVADNFGTAFI